MKNTKTTLRELTREYRHILHKCFLLNLGLVLMAGAANAQQADLTVEAGETVADVVNTNKDEQWNQMYDNVVVNGTLKVETEADQDAFASLNANNITINAGGVLETGVPAVSKNSATAVHAGNFIANGTEDNHVTINLHEKPDANEDETDVWVHASDSMSLTYADIDLTGGDLEADHNMTLDHVTITGSMASIHSNHVWPRPFYGLDSADKKELLSDDDYAKNEAPGLYGVSEEVWKGLSREEKIALNDEKAALARTLPGGKLEILNSSTITLTNGSEINRGINGDILVDNSQITLNKGSQGTDQQYSAVIAHEGTDGLIVIQNNSAVTLNGNSGIIRGVYDWADDDTKIFDLYRTDAWNNNTALADGMLSSGYIILRDSELTMNDTSFVAFSDFADETAVMNIENSILNVEGDNTIWADAVDVTGNSVINVGKGKTLSLIDTFHVNPDAEEEDEEEQERDTVGGLNLGKGSILNLSGTVNASLGNHQYYEGTVVIQDSDAAINGDINGVNLTVNSDWTLTSSPEHEIRSLGDVVVNENFTLNWPFQSDDDEELTPYDENEHPTGEIKSITVADDKQLALTSDAKFEVREGVLYGHDGDIHTDSLTLGDGATLKLKNVALDYGRTATDENPAVGLDLEANGVTLIGDQGDLYGRGDMIFNDSDITLTNEAEIGYGVELNNVVALNNTSLDATDSGVATNNLDIANGSSVTLTKGWLDVIDTATIDDSTVSALDHSRIMAETLAINNSAVNLKNSTILASSLNLNEDRALNASSSIVAEDSSLLDINNGFEINDGTTISLDHSDIVGHQDIVISGGTIELDHESELWSSASDGKITISGGNITLNNDSDINPEGILEINGGKIAATASQVGSIGLFKMSDGILTLNNGVFGSEGDYCGDDSCHKGGQVIIAGGTINVNPLNNVQSEATGNWDYKANVLMGQDMTMSGGEMTVASDAILALRDGFTDDSVLGSVSTLALTGGKLNLSGMFDGNITAGETAGTVNITASNAKINGNVSGIDMTIAEDFNSNNLKGRVNELGNLRIAEGKSLTLNLDGKITGSDHYDDPDLEVQSFTMGENSNLTLNGSAEKGESDIDAWGDQYVTGTANLHNAGLKQNGPDGSITIENAILSINNGDIASRSTAHDLDIINSKVTMTEAGIWKERTGDGEVIRGSGDLNITDSEIDMASMSVLINSTETGNINVKDSTVTLNDSVLSIGDVDYDETSDKFVLDPDGEYNYVDGTGKIILSNSTLNTNGTTWVHSGVDQKVLLNKGSTWNVSGMNNASSDISVDADSTINIAENGELIANVENTGNMNNAGSLNGNLLNNGTYTGSISGVKGIFDNTNGIVNTWGDLNKGLLGTTNFTQPSVLIQDLTFGNANVKDSLELGTHTLTADTFTVADGATVSFRVSGKDDFGKVIADTMNVSNEGTALNLTLDAGVLNKDEEETFTIFANKAGNATNVDFANLSRNARYEFVKNNDGTYTITGKATSADVIADAGGSSSDQATAAAWLDGQSGSSGFKEGSAASAIFDLLTQLSQQATAVFKEAVKALQPDSAPTGQATAAAINNQIASAVGGRFGGPAPQGGGSRGGHFGGPAPQGRSGGDAFKNTGLWAQGLATKSKLSKAQGFDGKTYGLALGADAEVAKGLKVGLGYAYTSSDIDATKRSTDVTTHTAIVYAEKAVGNVFVNGVATYGRSKYKENKNVGGLQVKADYDMDAIYTQLTTGYNFYQGNAMLTPEVGLRYLWTKTHTYTDTADQEVKSDKTNTLTGVIGGRASVAFQTENTVITPEVKLAATYDLKNDKGGSTVRLANGSSYAVSGDTLDRFGIETGAKVGVTVNNMEFSLSYEGKFKKDYSDHTGLVNFRYNF